MGMELTDDVAHDDVDVDNKIVAGEKTDFYFTRPVPQSLHTSQEECVNPRQREREGEGGFVLD